MRLRIATVVLAALTVWLQAGCGDICSAGRLTSALASAGAGDEVRIGACTIEGAFTVPAGVTLVGAGPGETILVTNSADPALAIEPGSTTTTVSALSVEVNDRIGVRASGSGSEAVNLLDIHVDVLNGIGIGVEDLASFSATNVTVQGPVTAENVLTFPSTITPGVGATHGLVLVNVASATMFDVRADGMAGYGALIIESTGTWVCGGVDGNLHYGLVTYAGNMDLQNLDVSRTFEGGGVSTPPIGGFFGGDGTVTSSSLNVFQNERFGLFHAGGSAAHVDLVGTDNDDVVVWTEDASSFEMSGAGTVLSNNAFAAIVVVNSSNVLLADARIEATRVATRVFAETGSIDVGDGIHLLRSTSSVLVDSVSLVDNERVGMLVDVDGGAFADVTLTNVEVDAMGTSLGVVGQGAMVPVGWDSDVARLGDTGTNDASFMGSLEAVGLISPCYQPVPSAVLTDGLGALLGP